MKEKGNCFIRSPPTCSRCVFSLSCKCGNPEATSCTEPKPSVPRTGEPLRSNVGGEEHSTPFQLTSGGGVTLNFWVYFVLEVANKLQKGVVYKATLLCVTTVSSRTTKGCSPPAMRDTQWTRKAHVTSSRKGQDVLKIRKDFL